MGRDAVAGVVQPDGALLLAVAGAPTAKLLVLRKTGDVLHLERRVLSSLVDSLATSALWTRNVTTP